MLSQVKDTLQINSVSSGSIGIPISDNIIPENDMRSFPPIAFVILKTQDKDVLCVN